MILTATSGDTGSAVAHGFYDAGCLKVVALYPEGRLKPPAGVRQMTALGGNIHLLRVAGTFDDCQLAGTLYQLQGRAPRIVGQFDQPAAVDSAGVLLLYGYFRWRQASGGENPVVVVPSGKNYGNLRCCR